MKKWFVLFWVVIVAAWVAGSCKTSSRTAAEVVETQSQLTIDSFLFGDSEVLVNRKYFNEYLHCDPRIPPISIDGPRHKQMSYFIVERHIELCIKDKVFMGDKIAESFLTEFLKTQKDALWQYNPERYRGEKVFLILLDLASTINCRDDDYETPYGKKPLLAAKEMIKSFGGYNSFREFKKNTELLSQIKKNSSEDFPCYTVARIINDQRLLQKAWEEGQIILKDYGED